jgi:CRP-like cAMP-binding protein
MLTSPLFEPFSDEEKNDLIKKFESCSFPKGKIVIEEGTENEFLYLVVLGELKVTARNSKGENLEVAILKEGDSFGEISLLNKGIPLATVTTMASCRLLKLPHGKFIEMIMTHPQVLELMAAISNNRINLLKQLAPQKIASSKGEGCALL